MSWLQWSLLPPLWPQWWWRLLPLLLLPPRWTLVGLLPLLLPPLCLKLPLADLPGSPLLGDAVGNLSPTLTLRLTVDHL